MTTAKCKTQPTKQPLSKDRQAVFFASAAAALYALNIPLAKLLLANVSTVMMAALLYLGAGLGVGLVSLIARNFNAGSSGKNLSRSELPYTLGMIVLDIAAPILLMLGLKSSSAAGASLLNNFEIVATTLIALLVFKELISKRLWIAILLITVASGVLSAQNPAHFEFSSGSLLVLAATICWGLENNCTRMLSSKSTTQIVTLKGIFSGLGSLTIALFLGERLPSLPLALSALLLGFVAYGMSIYFYILAQRSLGAAKTSAYYAIAPFLGVVFSFLIFKEVPGSHFFVALAIMLVGSYFAATDTIALQHTHAHTHTHTHAHEHAGIPHLHPHTHHHSHSHVHGQDSATEHEHRHDQIEGHDHDHHSS